MRFKYPRSDHRVDHRRDFDNRLSFPALFENSASEFSALFAAKPHHGRLIAHALGCTV